MKFEDLTPLAVGRVSDVYVTQDNLVFKLLHDTVPDWKVEEEFERCRIVDKAGVPSPKALEMQDMKGRKGILFEWAGKQDLLKAKLGNPLNLWSGAKFMASVHADFLSREAPDLPDIKDEAWRMAHEELPEGTIKPEQFDLLRRYLDGLPDGNAICHMDFHPSNIMLTDDGGYSVIDWAEAVKGCPEADAAMTSFMLANAETAPGNSFVMEIIISIFRKGFEKQYRKHIQSMMGFSVDGFEKWTLLLGVFRMAMWKLDSEREFLTNLIRENLEKLAQ
ncbi:aminoglycoside phosphotransferase [Desulfatibacillum aliphaticivorans]|uniref:Aminoglycoside phosphotransferase n=1 Tax=Desulfatibacillum aliphaticivorans TaxID=218208 RepID=B8FFK9_DESAL|nr:aminoglycoside phosphotransferase family protein [Desulfatibacillum aliphaticivorans]ACL04269.1 aminoglycoside phosphotransferase [Desulfatibacillum aliphaticivorans]